jgi:hypothetical protein
MLENILMLNYLVFFCETKEQSCLGEGRVFLEANSIPPISHWLGNETMRRVALEFERKS